MASSSMAGLEEGMEGKGPRAGGNGVSDSVELESVYGSLGAQYLREALASSQLVSNSQRLSQQSQYYMCVSDAYARRKLSLLLLPFAFRGAWSRRRDASTSSLLPPVDDLHAPDLLLPSAAILANSTLRASSLAISHSLSAHTQAVPTSLWSLFLSWLALAACFFLLLRSRGASSVPFLDALASSGYSLVYVALCTTSDLLLPSPLCLFAKVYLCAAAALFAAKTCARCLREGGVRRNVALVLSAACVQIFAILALSGIPASDRRASSTTPTPTASTSEAAPSSR